VPVDARTLDELLDEQRQVLTLMQAAEHGLSRHAVAHRLATARWQRVHPGVVATVSGTLDAEQRVWAGALYAGPGALLGRRTAWWWADRRQPEPEVVDLVIPEPRIVVRRPGLRITRTRRLDERDIHPTAQPARFRLERAVLDCASAATNADQAAAVLASAVQQRATTVPRLRAVLRRCPNLPRRALLAEILELADDGAHTLLEVAHARATAAHGLPRPDRQRRIGPYTVDAAYDCPRGTLIGEFDGRLGHLDAGGWWGDMSRDNENELDGYLTLRFAGFVLRQRPHEVCVTLARGLTMLGWEGTMRCPRNCPGR
jgi:very-short-patch-repair endonuclease